MSSPQTEPTSIWSPQLLGITVGSLALIVLAAFESLAVTTVMPVVSEELNGAALYSLAFAGTMAAGIIGMIGIGTWCDRRGPVMPLTAAVVLFIIGLLIAGFASTMEWLVVGRLIQGLGAGGQTVALYVVVGRLYPARLNGAIFAAYSTAWVVPSLVGPFIAGLVADTFHWRWVFLGVAIATIIAYALIFLKLRSIAPGGNPDAGASNTAVRLTLAVLVAALALVLGLLSDVPAPWNALIAVVTLVLMAIIVRPLFPAGTLRAARGLPSVILLRGLMAGALFGAEVYLPYLLRDVYDFPPTLSGLALTGSAVMWAIAANLQSRIGDQLGNARCAYLALAVLGVSVFGTAAVVASDGPAWALIVTWSFAGLGVGFMFPRTTVLMLAYSTPNNSGFNSSALSISDSLVSASAIAVLGIVLHAVGRTSLGFGLVIAGAALLAVLALIPAGRLGHAAERTSSTS